LLNGLSVDVEDYFHASALSECYPRERWDTLEHRVGANTNRLLDLFDITDTRGTFFVLGWVAKRYPEIVREIDRRGHEIACHGYSHRLVYEQSRSEFEQETKLAKEVIEQTIGKAVLGFRAASFSITEESRWALKIIADLGFKYDSSIYPVQHDRYGIPGESIRPSVHEFSTSRLIEAPPGVLELGKFKLPIGGGGYFRLFPFALTRTALMRASREPTRLGLLRLAITPILARCMTAWLNYSMNLNLLPYPKSSCTASILRVTLNRQSSPPAPIVRTRARFKQ